MRPIARSQGPVRVLHALSDSVREMLAISDFSDEAELLEALSKITHAGTVLFRYSTCNDQFVIRCSDNIVLKARRGYDTTECTSMQFLAKHLPDFGAPLSLGFLTCGEIPYHFMSFVAGVTLASVWSSLGDGQKHSVSSQLNSMLLRLRTLEKPVGQLGGLDQEGCKDVRRHTRISTEPLQTCDDIWEFVYGSSRIEETIYGRLLRQLSIPASPQEIAFIHGDVCPENIIVLLDASGAYHINALIDWEMSGFYPEGFECIRATNNLSLQNNSDWYLFLPETLSPCCHRESWVLDRLWDAHVV